MGLVRTRSHVPVGVAAWAWGLNCCRMASFVHLASEKASARIERSGIFRSKTRSGVSGVYAMPVLPNYFATHQWLRELKRRGHRVIVAVQFRIPDDEMVTVGHYGSEHRSMSATEAISVVTDAEDPRGYEVLIGRKVEPSEIHQIRHIRQVVGWRYWPDAHGHPPCPCPVCLAPGQYGVAKIRRRIEL